MHFLTARILRSASSLAAALVLAAAGLAGNPAAADCACMCMDGTYRTVCTTPSEVQSNLNICEAKVHEGCPTDPQVIERETYESPMEGAANCRTAQIYDARVDEYVAAKVCDAAPVSVQDG